MNNNRIRLTESQLHRVIKESVKKVLNESQKGIDQKNVVSERLAKSLGFQPEYRVEDNLELWGKTINREDFKPMLKWLGISRFTTSDNKGHVRITVKNEPKQTEEYRDPKRYMR